MDNIKLILYATHSLTLIESIVLGILAFFSFRKKTSLSRHMGFIFSFAIMSCIAYTAAFSSHSWQLCRAFYFFYYSGMTLIMNSLYFFVVEFSGIKFKTSSSKAALILTSADIICLFIFTLTTGIGILEQSPDYFNNVLWRVTGWNWYFNIHLGVSYFYTLGIVSLLIYKTCASPKHNRARYVNILLIIMFLIVANGIVIIFKYPFDYTVFFYGLAALLVYLFCFKYYSRHYVLNTVQNIINTSDRMVFMFDECHKCIWYNARVKEFFAGIPDLQNYLEKEFSKWRNSTSQFDDMESNYEWTIKWNRPNDTRQVHLSIQKNYDKLNNYMGCFFICEDITDKLEQEKEQKRLANMDTLTGVPKRDYFFANVKQTIRTRNNTPFLLICSNIVDFKIYNSIFGEEAGNNLLIQNAAHISKYNETTPVYGRISGDMFAMLIEEERFSEVPFIKAMNHLESEFSNTFYHLHMQVGVYKITNLNESVASMVEKAILAMELSKTDFTRRVAWYSDESLNKNLDEKIILGRFEKSLQNGEFKMFLQPQVTQQNQVLGAEALVRWIDSDGNILTPDKFIPVLEKTNVITKLDLFIWEEAAKQLQKWKKMGREDLHISVNISIKDLYYEDLFQVFTDLVKKYDIDPGKLNLEITETVFATDTESVNNLLQKLRAFGFHVELDDFGSGYSSLGLLKDISVDSLKIDMSFLRHSYEKNNETINKSWLILNEIAHLAQALKMETIVEGVEEKEQVEKLTEFGCNVYQGFYFARPESVAAFEERINLY